MPRTDHRRRNRPSSLARPLRFEALEDRQMLSITVTNLDDAGPGSLRAAILQANDEAGPETIEFDAALVGTIELTSGELVITDSLTINGSGPERLTIDAKQRSRVFNIDDGTASFLDVEIAGLTITGGRGPLTLPTRGVGGGIFSRENLAVTNSTISNNTAGIGGGIAGRDVTVTNSTISGNTADLYGGGISGEDVTVTNSTISGNTADRHGGGISGGDVTVTNSTISGNTAGDDGGGIYAEDNVTVTDSTISDNTASDVGGGIQAEGDVTVTNSTISGNTADGDGGGIYAYDNKVTVTNSTISGNTAGDGGGIFAYEGGVTITNSTISGNTAGNGGGIYCGQCNVTVTNSTISGNTAGNDGGGIQAEFNVTVTNSTISGNTARGNGGGIYAEARGNVTVTSSIISGNTADEDDNIYAASLATSFSLIGGRDPQLAPLADNGGPTKTHALLTGSPAIDAGDPDFSSPPQFDQRGAPRVIDGDGDAAARIDIGAYERQTNADLLLVVDTAIDESDGDYSPGDLSLREAIELANDRFYRVTIGFDTAGVFGAAQTILLTMGELKITGSLTIDGPGPDVVTIDANGQSRTFNIDDGFTRTRFDIEIGGLTITGGGANERGGGILSRENLSLTNSTISDNTTDREGGAIFASGDLTITNSTISGNSAGEEGGGIYVAGDVMVTSSIISGNTAIGNGGGLLSYGDVTLNNSTISDNTSDDHGGGIYALSDEADDLAVTVTGSTISGNTARHGGGGISSYSEGFRAAVTVTGSTISGNTAQSGGAIFADPGGGEVEVTVTDSTISGNTANDAGGGIWVYSDGDDVAVIVNNSTISGNTVNGRGGGIFADTEDDAVAVIVTGSTISGNTARVAGGGIWANPATTSFVEVTVTGSILSGNTTDGQVSGDVIVRSSLLSFFRVSHSLIGLAAADLVTAGSGNIITDDPQLAPLADNGGPTQTHALLPGSPAIDAGDPDFATPPAFDQRGAPFARVVNDRIDIGAYEFSRPSLPADLTGNGFVDFEDLTVLLAAWNQNVSAAEGNLVDAAGTPVNFEDLTVLLAAWTGPGGAGAAQAVVVGGDSVGDFVRAGPGVAVGDASYRRHDGAPRRAAIRSRSASGTYGIYGRLQAVAVDRAMGEEETFERRGMVFARRARRPAS